MSFNDTVTVDVRPTTDKQAVIRAIGDLTAGRRTALWDGMIAGLDLANADLGARLLVLSDGGDTVSAATVDDVNARAAAEGIPIDIVALTPTVSHAQVLRTVATSERRAVPARHRRHRPQPGLRRGDRVVRRQGRGVGPGAARGRGQRQVRDRDGHSRRHGVHGNEPAASQRGARGRGRRGGRATDDGRHRRHAGRGHRGARRRLLGPDPRRAPGRPDRDHRRRGALLLPSPEDVEAARRAGALVLGRDEDRASRRAPARMPGRGERSTASTSGCRTSPSTRPSTPSSTTRACP